MLHWFKRNAPQQSDNHLAWLARCRADGISISKEQLIYYQAKTNLLDLTPRYAVQSRLAGNYLAKSKGRGMEFDEVRHYQPGDDIRTIDWRVTARTGKTHTKLFREEKERPVFILTDLTSSMMFGSKLLLKSVQACHISALIAWAAKKRGDKVGGLVFNQTEHRELKPRSRQQGVLQLIHELSTIHEQSLTLSPDDTQSGKAFESALGRLRRLAHPGSLIFIISDFTHLSDAALKHIREISRHNQIMGYQISDPLEHQLPDSSIKQSLPVTNGSDDFALTVGDSRIASDWAQLASSRFEQTQRQLFTNRVSLNHLSSGLPLETQLMTSLRSR